MTSSGTRIEERLKRNGHLTENPGSRASHYGLMDDLGYTVDFPLLKSTVPPEAFGWIKRIPCEKSSPLMLHLVQAVDYCGQDQQEDNPLHPEWPASIVFHFVRFLM